LFDAVGWVERSETHRELAMKLMGFAARLGKNTILADWMNECTIRYDESYVQDRH
jgi:hypothetical protein